MTERAAAGRRLLGFLEVGESGGEEARGFAPGDRAVVEGERERHRFAHRRCAVDGDDARCDAPGAEDRHLGRHDDRDRNGFYQIYARGLTGQGQGRFSEFTVNTEWSGQQLRPHVGIAANGDSVVVWEDDQDENGFYQIYARGLTADSNEVFGDLTVNSKSSGQQLRPRVGVAANGDFVVVWQDDSQQDGNARGIQGQRFALPIFADGFESGDTGAWSSTVP